MAATGQRDKPPRREIGAPVQGGQTYLPSITGWTALMAEGEHVPDLHPPQLYRICDQMLTNPQVWALFMGLMLPLMEYDYGLEPGDADAAMTAELAADLGLPVGLPTAGDTAPPLSPGRYRFNFLSHLWEALFAPAYGHYWFEQVAAIDDGDGLAHLVRLEARAPHDITEIVTDDHGGLVAIMHPGVRTNGNVRFITDVPIPASQVVGYVWLPDARRRWVGRSMLRPCYEPWLLRDRLVRIDTANHQKAGGVPGFETDETWQGADLQELRNLASQFNVSEWSGWAAPPGAHLKLAQAGGTAVIDSVRYHDEAMARAWGEMVRQLGQTQTGSRALGATMADMEAVTRRAVIRWFAGTFREHVIEDWWAWNVPKVDGVLPPHPSLAWRPRDDGQVPGDPAGGPPPDPQSARPVSPAGRAGDAGHRSSRYPAVAAQGARLPDRPLRRQPYEHELRAAVDFEALDVAYTAGVDEAHALLDREWLPVLIQTAGDAVRLTKGGTVRQRLTRADASRMAIPAPSAADLAAVLLAAAREGAANAVAELLDQGQAIVGPSDEQLAALVADHAQAVAQQTADGVTIAASRRAVQLAGSRPVGEVAGEVETYLGGLAHQWERDQLRGAVQAATNAARLEVFARIPSEATSELYASELLDVATCGPCAAVDGMVFADLGHAQRFYPGGGYIDCQGGPRCRGTVIAVLAESEIAPGTPPLLGPG